MFRYEVTSTKFNRDLFKEILVALVASLFMVTVAVKDVQVLTVTQTSTNAKIPKAATVMGDASTLMKATYVNVTTASRRNSFVHLPVLCLVHTRLGCHLPSPLHH